MLSNILYKALLKLSKENRDNNYIYSNIDFPVGFVKQKLKIEKMEKLIKGKNLFTCDRYFPKKKSKNTPILLSLKKKTFNSYNNDSNQVSIQKVNSFNKNENKTYSLLPKVNNYKSQNNFNEISEIKQISKIYNNTNNYQKISLQLTPKSKKTFDFEKNLNDKIINKFNKHKNDKDSNSAFSIHLLNINAPRDKIQKDLLSISRNILNQKKYIGEKGKVPIQIKMKELNENINKERDRIIESIQSRIQIKLKSNSNNKTLKNKKKDDNSISFSIPKQNNHFPPKLYPMALINNYREKYILINDIDNLVNKKMELFPFFKSIFFCNNEKYYYSINKMYVNQIREYMKHRINWEYVSEKQIKSHSNGFEQKNINFSWRYYSNRIYYKRYKYNPSLFSNSFSIKKLKMINLFERNYEIGNKKYMFINLINYCDKIKMNVFDIVPFTIIINNSPDVEVGLDALKEIVSFVEKNSNKNKNLITNRKYNEHFWFDKNFEKISKQYININKNFLSEKNYWIVKPTDLYQGKCIDLFNNFEQIYKKCKNIFRGVDKRTMPEISIKEGEDDSDDDYNNINNNISFENDLISTLNKRKTFYSRMYCSNEIIIQKYLDNPLLYNNRKFDIRCFVLVDYNLNIYFFKEGHLKASSELYNLNNNNKFIHITNYSLQKKSSKFETYEEGNEISYNDFKQFMISKNIPLNNFNKMINQMKSLVEISMKSVGKRFLKTTPVLSFEIFGYDFIIDNEFKPWILEINNNPGLVISSPVIQKIIPRMLDDAFRLTIDKIFETSYSQDCIDENGNYKSKFKLEGYSDEENVFEFLCNIK